MRIAARDQFVELELAGLVQAQQARKVHCGRARRTAALERLLLEGSVRCARRGVRAAHAHHHRGAALAQAAIGLGGDAAEADAFEGVVGAAAGQLLQRLHDVVPPDVEHVGGAEGPGQRQLGVVHVDGDDDRGAAHRAALDGVEAHAAGSRTPRRPRRAPPWRY
jgi:hypothetical protein